MNKIFVVNRSTLVTDADAKRMTSACDLQLRWHLLPVWGLQPIYVSYSAAPPPGAWVITLLDTLDQADALGYHTENGSSVFGVVGAKVVLDHGAKALTGPYSVASILSHEILEMAVDPFVSSWADSGQGWLAATETCDPVQSDTYVIGGCSVSNFVLPQYFNPQAGKGTKVDYLGRLAGPFSIGHGGYLIRMEAGVVSQVFGQQMPAWLREMKQNTASRTQRISRV